MILCEGSHIAHQITNHTGTILALILALITLPKAGNLPWVMPVLSTLMAAALLLSVFDKTQSDSTLSTTDRAWLSVWLTYSVWALIQYFVVPRLVSWNSVEHNIPGLTLAHRPVNSLAAIESWVTFNVVWSFTYLVSKLDSRSLKRCIWIILLITLFQAFYGVIANLNNQQTILGIWEKKHYTTSATGSFVNHNHFANYIAVASPMLIGYLLAQNTHIQVRLHIVYRYLIVAFFYIIISAALLASLSRMGFAAGMIGMTGIFIVFLTQYLNVRYSIKTLVIVLFIAIMIAALSFFGIDEIIGRYRRVFIHDMRWSIWKATGELPVSLWLFGSGGGSFIDVFWPVHPATTPKTAYYAHNDYLQFLIEYGITGTMLMAIAMRYWFKRVHCSGRGLIKTGCLFSILVMALHSSVDFSLHIPANALLFWFCIGCYLNPDSRSKTKRLEPILLREIAHRQHFVTFKK